ncbi:unnamed protein product [Diamesa hyperborea]
MNYRNLNCAQQAENDRKRIDRIEQVRRQSNEIAKQLREKVHNEKEIQLRKLAQTKEKELNEWKCNELNNIEKDYENCMANFGAAHKAAQDYNVEQGIFRKKRHEFDLMAAERGRSSMQQEHRRREKEAEEKLIKKKKLRQKTIGIQADLLKTQRSFGREIINLTNYEDNDNCEDEDEEDGCRVSTFKSKSNPPRQSSARTSYNPKNFTSNSVESFTQNEGSDQTEDSTSNEESLEFNQITNLLKQKCWEYSDNEPVKKNQNNRDNDVRIEDLSSDESDEVINERYAPPPPTMRPKSAKSSTSTRGILKSEAATSSKTKSPRKQATTKKKPNEEDSNAVQYHDIGNKYTRSYIPEDDLVTYHKSSKGKPNAMQEAKDHEQNSYRGMNADILRQLTEIRSKEALEKEKTRRDYERLRLELDEITKNQNETIAAGKAFTNFSIDQIQKKSAERNKKMDQAVENVLKKRTVITCPPVDHNDVIETVKRKSSDLNVAAKVNHQNVNSESSDSFGSIAIGAGSSSKQKPVNKEINNLVKVEKLKDLLERINMQKKLLLREIEKSEDIPGPDLDKVMKCIEKLEKEKDALAAKKVSSEEVLRQEMTKETGQLLEREKKISERERRLEDKIRELYRNEKQKQAEKVSEKKESVKEVASEITSISSSDSGSKPTPVEIIIKVHQNTPKKRSRKTYRVIDTLSREPGRVYPKTPMKQHRSSTSEVEEVPVTINVKDKVNVELPQASTQKLPQEIRKEPQATRKESQFIVPAPPQKSPVVDPQENKRINSASSKRSVDSSLNTISTSYQSLPERLNILMPTKEAATGIPSNAPSKSQKLNPVLMHYITRLLGMSKNISTNLGVNVSPITSPGTSTINVSENNEPSEINELSFSQDRLENLKKFIQDNYSFLSEINESLEKSQVQGANEENISKVDNIWKDVLSKRKTPKQREEGKTMQSQKEKPTAQLAKLPSNLKEKTISNKLTKPPVIVPIRTSIKTTSKIVPAQQKSKKPMITVPASNGAPQKISKPPTNPTTSITTKDMLNVTKYLESHMLNNYAEYTANAQKKIAHLAEMMEQVRQEKLKLIENSLSSGEFVATEYKDIAVPVREGSNLEVVTTSGSDLKSPSQDPPSEEINNILTKQRNKQKEFGVSKDSGISMSRPVTSSDFRDSPDARVTSTEERETTFQPILNDIPKVPRVKITSGDDQATTTVEDMSLLIRQQEVRSGLRKQKPPLSLNRFSPHLEKFATPHELSTIAEVETPSTSKMNIQADEQPEDFFNAKNFPNFSDYEKMIKDGTLLSDPSIEELKKLLESIRYESFGPPPHGLSILTEPDDSKRDEDMSECEKRFKDITMLGDLKYQSFGPPPHGISTLTEPDESNKKDDDNVSNASSTSSILDIVAELKRRKIMDKSFEIIDGSGESDGSICDFNVDDKTTPTATHQVIAPKSPRKKTQSRFAISTPENFTNEAQKLITTPVKRKQQGHPQTQGLSENDTLNGIKRIGNSSKNQSTASLEQDFKKLGLNWAASMMKRNSDSNKLQSSSSSTSIDKQKSKDMSMDISESSRATSASTSSGLPLNLRDFLQRELTLKTQNDKYLSNDSSLSSQFMRSLLNVSTSTGNSSSQNRDSKLRTSTPVPNNQTIGNVEGNTNLFTIDSVSTVRLSGIDSSGGSAIKRNSTDS